jgi:uncharacterized protein YerC
MSYHTYYLIFYPNFVMRKKSNELSNQERMETLDALYTAASTIKGREAMKRFLKDLLTESERIMLGRRILVARAILSGLTYDEIVENFKVGKDTVYRVSKWLDDQVPGYEEAIANLEKEFDKRKTKYDQPTMDQPLAYLKKRYPLHFLFFPPYKRN